jgi:hypothetical protein
MIEMTNNVLEKESLVSEILTELSKYDYIPNAGFLAGGAVANTILKMVWGGDYPVNDLDIFIETNEYNSRSFTPIRSNSLNIEGDGYMITKMAYDSYTTYSIDRVEREGFLNTIYIKKTFNTDTPKTDYTYVLSGFDFNCCQVGIDLSTNKLIYTEEFKNFLYNKQLEVTAIYTPSHTAIRLFKKMDELDCYCDIEKCMELLSQPLILENINKMTVRSFGIYFGSKYKEMYLKYRTNIKEYFTISKYFDHKRDLWKLRNDPKNNDLDSNEKVNWLIPNYSVPQEILSRWAKFNDVIWTLTPKKYSVSNVEIFSILEGLSFNPLTFMSAYKLISGSIGKKQKSKAEIILKNGYFCKMLCLINKGFHNCDFDKSHIDYIEKYVDSERWILFVSYKFNMNVQETYTLVKDINKLFNSDGEWISPLLQKSLLTRNILFKPTYDNMLSELTKEKKKYGEDITKPTEYGDLNLPYDIKIKELTSVLDLRWAGNKLKNCINNPGQNYKSKIKTGKTKIFVLITPNNMSALEIQLSENEMTYKMVQILSYCNKETSEYHKSIGNILVNRLNHILFIQNYEKKLRSFSDIELLNRGFLITLKDEDTKGNSSSFGLEPVAVRNEYIVDLPVVEDEDDLPRLANNVDYDRFRNITLGGLGRIIQMHDETNDNNIL